MQSLEPINTFIELAGRIIAVLAPAAPYLMKAAEGAAGKMGADAWQRARELYDKLRERFRQDKNDKAAQTIELFIADTDTFEGALGKLLVTTLAQHPQWAEEIRALLDEPSLQEIIARNRSHLERVTQSLSGSGTQRIESDDSTLIDVKQKKR